MQMLCKKILISEEFEGPHGHHTLEKGLLNVNYALKRFLVDTTWRCTWKLTLDKGLTNEDIEEIVANISPKPQSWRYIIISDNGFSPRWWRYAWSGLKLEWIPFYIFHRWYIQDCGFGEMFATISSMSSLVRPLSSVNYHVHLQVESTKKCFSS